jgi:intraflagellar transport protein 56
MSLMYCVIFINRLNLVIYHLRHGSVNDAYDLVRDMEPSTPQEYVIKGVVHATIGQQTNSREHLKMAQQCFQLVGTSSHECDTIPGRQCMASCFYLMRQFEDVNIYLNSIKVRGIIVVLITDLTDLVQSIIGVYV